MEVRSNDWFQLHDLLRQPLGEEAANKLMEFLPAVPWTELATKQDIELLRSHDLVLLRNDLHGGMAELRSELRGEMAELRTELRGEMAELRAEFHDGLRHQTVWLVGVMMPTLLAGMGLAAAIGH